MSVYDVKFKLEDRKIYQGSIGSLARSIKMCLDAYDLTHKWGKKVHDEIEELIGGILTGVDDLYQFMGILPESKMKQELIGILFYEYFNPKKYNVPSYIMPLCYIVDGNQNHLDAKIQTLVHGVLFRLRFWYALFSENGWKNYDKIGAINYEIDKILKNQKNPEIRKMKVGIDKDGMDILDDVLMEPIIKDINTIFRKSKKLLKEPKKKPRPEKGKPSKYPPGKKNKDKYKPKHPEKAAAKKKIREAKKKLKNAVKQLETETDQTKIKKTGEYVDFLKQKIREGNKELKEALEKINSD